MKAFAAMAHRANTTKSYAAQQRIFINMCQSLQIDHIKPLSEQDLCLLITCYAESHKPTTIPAFVSALVDYAKHNGLGDLPRNQLYEDVRKGLSNYLATTNVSVPKQAFTLEDLCVLYQHIDHQSFTGARDWCAICLAFFGLLRVGEYMGGALLYGHITVHRLGLSIRVMFSKTSLIPTTIDISSRGDQLCPSQAFAAYRTHLSRLPFSISSNTALFLTVLQSGQYTPMTDTEFIAALRALITKAFPDRDTQAYAGHSFRRGGATAMKLAGISDAIIQMHGRWKSDAFALYFDKQNIIDVRLLATQGMQTIASSAHMHAISHSSHSSSHAV